MEQISSGVFRLTFGTPETGTPSRQVYVKPPRNEAETHTWHTPLYIPANCRKLTSG